MLIQEHIILINIIQYGLLVITDETIIIPDIFHIYS
jgi:hypothetical protein